MLSRILYISVLVLGLSLSLNAQSVRPSQATTSAKCDVMALDFEDNLNSPKIKKGQTAAITAYQHKLGIRLKTLGYNVETTRSGEVLIITIPAHSLFNANATDMSTDAATVLQPLVRVFKNSDCIKLLLAMHSDNTGNDTYSDELTTQRVLSVYDFFKGQNMMPQIVPYGMGNSEPLVANDTRANRQTNRRLEIYIVPNQAMIQRAKNNTLR